MRRAAQHLIDAPEMDQEAITNMIWEDRYQDISKVVELGRSVSSLEDEINSQFAEVAWDTDVTTVRTQIAAHGRSWLRFFKSSYREAIATYRGIIRNELPKTHSERLDSLDQLIQGQKKAKQLREDQRILKIGESAFGDHWNAIESDWDQLAAILEWVKAGSELKSGLNLRKLLVDLQQQEIEGHILRSINTHLKPVYILVDELLKSFNIALEEAFNVRDLRKVPLHNLQSRLQS
jgi:hypothetical protein